MIKVKHPLEHCNKMQEEMIVNTPIDEREFNELLFSYGNATYRYHARAKDFEPTKQDYIEWLSGLPSELKKDMEERGFSGCQGILSFTRYVNEKNDIGMEEYVRELMGPEAYSNYKRVMANLKSE